jgi:hypothetical protein
MRPRTTRLSDSDLKAGPARAGEIVEEVLRHTAQLHRGLAELRALSEHVAKLPDVMALWFTDRAYLDANGNPEPLPFRGRKKSFSALIRRVFPEGDVNRIAESLVASGSVLRKGHIFRAVRFYVSFSEDPSFARVHSLDAVDRLLGTIQHNLRQTDPEQRLFERNAIVHSIPLAALPSIHKRIREEVGALVERIDNFLREHQQLSGSGLTTTVVLGAYESIEPMPDAKLAVDLRKPRRTRKRAGARS